LIEPFEQLTIINYLQNLLKNNRLSSAALKEVCDFLENKLTFLGIDGNNDKILDVLDDFKTTVKNNAGARKLYNSTVKEIGKVLTARKGVIKGASSSTIANNIATFTRELDLDELEAGFFGLIVRYRIHDQFSSLLNDLSRDHLSVPELCAICLGTDRKVLAEKLSQSGRLLSSGAIVQMTHIGKDVDDHFNLPDVIYHSMLKTIASTDDVRTFILGAPQKTSLSWDDFEHLGNTRNKLAAFLGNVVEQQIPGVNILLWGPPGTGKTEFCKTLASQLGLNLYSLGEVDDAGGEPTRSERTCALKLAQNLLRYQKNSLLLFDEMDDLFENKGMSLFFGGKLSMGSKVFTNRMFENNPVPTIWTINNASLLDESVIRRMALAIEIKVPPAKSRENVWRRLLEKHQVPFPDEEIEQLSQIDISPAVADNAVRFAGLVGSTMEDFQFATQGIIKATKGRIPLIMKGPRDPYLPELINAGTDISKLADQLTSSTARNFSLCLYGPPGTGKSAYVRYLADRLGMPVLFKRASDLISMYVGESERNIALAFEEAIEKESFLVFDEADSLLGDRRYAQRSWEVSQVNEMLTWMESHPLPFACTTNLMDRLDQASLRRFTFKCNFDYLKSEQIAAAFKHFFSKEIQYNKIGMLENVTPGDFAVVVKKMRFSDQPNQCERIIELLLDEVRVKSDFKQKKLGFRI
jgi:SpoVK/Ycf46/Vps4 family AAA+-type ATPase